VTRIRIDDLSVADGLTPEQEELILGAGLRSFRPRLEFLEGREMMDAGIGSALAGPSPLFGKEALVQMGAPPANQPTIEIQIPRAASLPLAGSGQSAARFEVRADQPLGPVQTLKGSSDASAAAVYTTPAGQKFMFVAGDEDQKIRMYQFDASAKEYKVVKTWDFTENLDLSDTKGGTPREVDIEAVTMSGNKLYWIGSGSNRGEEFKDAPNRDRIFRTDIRLDANGLPELSFVGYTTIEEALIERVPSLGAAARAEVDPKSTAGYNIEGLTTLPNGSVGIAFRAWGTESANALIVPVTNLDAVLTGGVRDDGQPKAPPQFAAPIWLDLGGRGIRDIMGSTYKEGGVDRWQFLIIAGPAGGATGIGNDDFRLYTWTGDPRDRPVMHNANLLGLTPEAVVLPGGNTKWDANTVFGLISDNGATVFDNNVEGKDQAAADKQSRIDSVKLGAANEFVSKDLLETRRQGFLTGTRVFTFTATGPRAYFEVLGDGRDGAKIEVIKVGESQGSTGTTVLNLSQLSEGSRYTVRVTPASTDVYTLSWRV
jgi:hypothetical protein